MNPGHPFPHKTPAEMLDFLRTHVRRDEDCLIWAGATDTSGYPKISWHGKAQSAKRLLATLVGRAPHRRQVVYASCGNVRCMAEDHMRVGSKAQAYAAAAKNGGNRPGVHRSLAVALGRSTKARMGFRQAPDVYRMLDAGASYAQIAERFGVHKSQIGHSVKTWKRMGITPMTVRLAA